MSKKHCSECKKVISAAYFPYLFGPCGECREATARDSNLITVNDYELSRASLMRSMLHTGPELLRAIDEAKGSSLRNP